MKCKGIGPNAYVGKVTNMGAQRVEAPISQPKPKIGKVKTGSDLRTK